jgi:hypothetical protein
MGQAFSLLHFQTPATWGAAPGWYGAGPLALAATIYFADFPGTFAFSSSKNFSE